jgi:DNA-binding CsgD family transcriptional regulator
MTAQPTARELEVLAAFIARRSRKAAAAELGISVNTVKTILARAYRKIDVDCVLDAEEWMRCHS